jgi:hypothetical protein
VRACDELVFEPERANDFCGTRYEGDDSMFAHFWGLGSLNGLTLRSKTVSSDKRCRRL